MLLSLDLFSHMLINKRWRSGGKAEQRQRGSGIHDKEKNYLVVVVTVGVAVVVVDGNKRRLSGPKGNI